MTPTTSIREDTYADSNLAGLFKTLAQAKDHDVVNVVDFAAFAPADGRPVAFAGTPVFDGITQIGVLFIQFLVDATNRIMTGNQHWQADGLDETGES